ncbi:MAG: selenocysteine-specific translation elongation factor [Actinobacteria bacterium]|nr:selenocysteine-specific translation elongation factor [Actinomycetota bacterium]
MSAPPVTRPSRVVATAGHVDHGKSTLVRALTGTDPDRWAEEKARGLTIDLGFAWTRLPSGAEVSFVDVPGHIRFLPNMLAGVGGVAACVFVVAATEGWMPQSEEHLRILDLLGTGTGIVALTKVGGLDDDSVELARLEIAEALAGTFLQGAPVVAVDAPSGVGLDEMRAALDVMIASTDAPADLDRPRLWVDRSFAASGAGTVVTGTLTGGAVAVGDQLELAPAAADFRGSARVRAIQAHGAEVGSAGPGRRLALNLAGPSRHDIGRGQALVRPGQWVLTSLIDVDLHVVPGLDHELTRRGSFLFHVGSHACGADVQLLGGRARMGPGESGPARLRLEGNARLPLMPGDRFVLRESGREETVGGGEVLDVAPVLRPGRASPDRSVDRVVAERGWVRADLLARLTGVRREPNVGAWVVSPAAQAATEGSLRVAVDSAGSLGVQISALDERQRALVPLVADLEVSGDRLRRKDTAQEHPGAVEWLAALAAEPFAPPSPDGLVGRDVVRDLVRRSLVVEAGGLFFHASAVELAAAKVAALLARKPQGVTVAEVREELGTSRKWAMPLLSHLDAHGVTRRRGDLRVAGPRLPAADREAGARSEDAG